MQRGIAKFAGISNEEMDKLTPDELLMKYQDKWIKSEASSTGK
jgi:hypothetical protein